MKLDRNIDLNYGRGKYALLKLRRLALYQSDKTFERFTPEIEAAIKLLEDEGILDWGEAGTEAEFFVMRLKDRSSHYGLMAYATDAETYDLEWADEVREMAMRAGPFNAACKTPD